MAVELRRMKLDSKQRVLNEKLWATDWRLRLRSAIEETDEVLKFEFKVDVKRVGEKGPQL
jgi:hypothetical protein